MAIVKLAQAQEQMGVAEYLLANLKAKERQKFRKSFCDKPDEPYVDEPETGRAINFIKVKMKFVARE